MRNLLAIITLIFLAAAMTPGQSVHAQAACIFQETSGNVIFEAENYNRKSAGTSGDEWTFVTAPSGFTGSGAMQALPDTGTFESGTNGPILEFDVNFTTTGNYYIASRRLGATADSNGIKVALNGTIIWNTTSMTVTNAAYIWHKGGTTTMNIPTAGIYTISVYMSDDGFIADKFWFSTNTNMIAQGSTATGNAESSCTAYTPTPTATFTATATPTATFTPTFTETPTATFTPTFTETPTATFTPTFTETPTATFTPTFTETPTATFTPTFTETPSETPIVTFTPSNTPTETLTPSPTLTPTVTNTPGGGTDTPTPTFTPTLVNTPAAALYPQGVWEFEEFYYGYVTNQWGIDENYSIGRFFAYGLGYQTPYLEMSFYVEGRFLVIYGLTQPIDAQFVVETNQLNGTLTQILELDLYATSPSVINTYTIDLIEDDIHLITIYAETGTIWLDYFMVLRSGEAYLSGVATPQPTWTLAPSTTPQPTATPLPLIMQAINPAARYINVSGQIAEVVYSVNPADVVIIVFMMLLLGMVSLLAILVMRQKQ